MKNFAYTVFLSVVAALGGLLYGYDTAVISGTISMVVSKFGLDVQSEGMYVGCALIGSIVGVLLTGMIADRFGRKKALIISSVLFTVSAVGCALSSDFISLVVYRIVGGIGIGVASVVAPMYISEISEPKYRGRLVSLYQLAITVGFLGAYLVNYLILKGAEGAQASGSLWSWLFVAESWRGMLAAESAPAILFVALLFFIPESPRWLELRMSGSMKKESQWKYIMKPSLFKAVLIGAAIAILGQFMGVNAVLYYGPSIFEKSGLSSGDSLFYQVLIGLVNVLTTVLAVFIIDKVGRKKLVYFGVSGMIFSLLGIAWYFHFGSEVSSYVLLAFFLFYIFCCAISICAVIFVLLSEMYPTKIRGLAMSIAELSLWIGTWLIGQLTPLLLATLRPEGTFLLFACMCVPYILIIWKLVPETTGKSLEEIEEYWLNK